MKAIVFASQRDVQSCKEALRRLGCRDVRVISKSDDIDTTDSDVSMAVVEIFDPDHAAIGYRHVADDRSMGIKILRALRAHCPDCAVLALSHSSCLNGSKYAESQHLADRAEALDWVVVPAEPAFDMAFMIERGLGRAQEVHDAFRSVREAS
jgi:hypothetical protein